MSPDAIAKKAQTSSKAHHFITCVCVCVFVFVFVGVCVFVCVM
jgi:hypothetical protein